MIGAIVAGALSEPTAPVTNSYESIQTYIVGSGGQSTITFSSIPSTYKHLQIRYIARGASGSASALRLSLNGATSAYKNHYLEGDGSTAYSGAETNTNGINIYGSFTTTANVFGVGIIDILDYANTNKYKTTRTLSGVDMNGSGYVDFDSGLYMSTSAVSSIALQWDASYTIAQYSSFALYGIKG